MYAQKEQSLSFGNRRLAPLLILKVFALCGSNLRVVDLTCKSDRNRAGMGDGGRINGVCKVTSSRG